MVVSRFKAPTRSQLARMSRGEDGKVDERLVRAFEQLWVAAGSDVPDVQDQVDANATAIVQLGVETAANAARIKTNEVLLWLSM